MLANPHAFGAFTRNAVAVPLKVPQKFSQRQFIQSSLLRRLIVKIRTTLETTNTVVDVGRTKLQTLAWGSTE